ncbi:phosphoribosyltransferase [Lentzea flava]|uniref:Phosphoribosyltransferase domain-containing protein n=1 Tax=Lentzea flava TaxID=103732 RepID=A0ABQ2UTF3_9PSEU|nr:phosphoribosyltransferase family protein [Lentzea flava]MCP2197263.1 putative phosphoribosyltransferase [Lentzea flava]GGU50354.1 hypothetical protein GCM10010178_48890 [Lentzea flava]
MRFADRAEAGRLLAERLTHLRGQDVVVLGLARGGVPVAHEVARSLGAPLDVVVVHELGVPHRPELVMGAIGEGGVYVVDLPVLMTCRVTLMDLERAEARERAALGRRARRYREARTALPLAGRTAVVVDGGTVTGAVARTACRVARARGAGRVVFAAPVVAAGLLGVLHEEADDVVCLESS